MYKYGHEPFGPNPLNLVGIQPQCSLKVREEMFLYFGAVSVTVPPSQDAGYAQLAFLHWYSKLGGLGPHCPCKAESLSC